MSVVHISLYVIYCTVRTFRGTVIVDFDDKGLGLYMAKIKFDYGALSGTLPVRFDEQDTVGVAGLPFYLVCCGCRAYTVASSRGCLFSSGQSFPNLCSDWMLFTHCFLYGDWVFEMDAACQLPSFSRRRGMSEVVKNTPAVEAVQPGFRSLARRVSPTCRIF